jgi:hypothetical protein
MLDSLGFEVPESGEHAYRTWLTKHEQDEAGPFTPDKFHRVFFCCLLIFVSKAPSA